MSDFQVPTVRSLVKLRHRAYTNWRNIRALCTNPNHQSYKYVGGAGVTMHPAWVNDFEQFTADVGHPTSMSDTLRRISRSAGYLPGNVIWARPYGSRSAPSDSVIRRAARGGITYPGANARTDSAVKSTLNRQLTAWGMYLSEELPGLFDLFDNPGTGYGAEADVPAPTRLLVCEGQLLHVAATEALKIVDARTRRAG
jgi:hypothetical protein